MVQIKAASLLSINNQLLPQYKNIESNLILFKTVRNYLYIFLLMQ